MNITWNPETERVEWAPYRGDYGSHYASDTIELIEDRNCVKGCTRAGTKAERDEFGPGGNCHILALVALGDSGQVIPELDPRPDGPHCWARVPRSPRPKPAPRRRRAPAGMEPLL